MLGNFFLANHIPVGIATVEYLTYVLMQFSHIDAKLQNIPMLGIIICSPTAHRSLLGGMRYRIGADP